MLSTSSIDSIVEALVVRVAYKYRDITIRLRV